MKQHNSISKMLERLKEKIDSRSDLKQDKEFLQDVDNTLSSLHSLIKRKKKYHRFIVSLLIVFFLLINFLAYRIYKYTFLSNVEVIHHTLNTAFPDSHLDIYFNKDIMKENTAQKIKITPNIPFSCSWKNRKRLFITFLKRIPKANTLRITLDNFVALDGAKLENPYSITFSTKPLNLLSFDQREQKRDGTIFFLATFDDSVSLQALRKNLSLKDEQGNLLSFSLERNEDDEEFDFDENEGDDDKIKIRTKLRQGQKKLFVTIDKKLQGNSGPLHLKKTFEKNYSFRTNFLRLQRYRTYAPSVGKLKLFLYVSDAVTPEIESAIQITPKVSYKINTSHNPIEIVGDFNPSKEYALTIQKGAKSKNGWRVKGTIKRFIRFKDRNKFVRFSSDGEILNLRGKKTVNVEIMNCTKLEVTIHKVYNNNLVYFLRRGKYRSSAEKFGNHVLTKVIPVYGNRNTLIKKQLDIAAFVPESTGTYYIRIRDLESSYWNARSDSKFLVLTDLGFTVKKFPSGYFCWVNSLFEGKPLKNVLISVLDRKNQKIGEAFTNTSGIAFVKGDGAREPYLFQAQKGKDITLLKHNRNYWNNSYFDVRGIPSSKGYKAYIFSDRGVYRPGESVHIVSILRNKERAIPQKFPLEISIKRADNIEVFEQLLAPNKEGIVEVYWQTLSKMRTGKYRAMVKIPGSKKILGQYSFYIEAFRPDRFKLSIQTNKNRYFLRESLDATIQANYLHGAPAGERKVDIAITLHDKKFESKFSHYSFGDAKKRIYSRAFFRTQKKLNKRGKVAFSTSFPTNITSSSLLQANIQVTLRDKGGKTTSRKKKVTIFPYSDYIGMQCKKATYGKSTQVNIVVLNHDGMVIKKKKHIHITLIKSRWIWSLQRYSGRLRYRYTRKEDILSQSMLEVNGGYATYTFTPNEYGEYQVVALSKQSGMKTVLSVSTWNSPNFRGKGAKEYITIIPDKKKYAPLSKATFTIKAPFDGSTLVCLEREKVYDSKVIEIKNGTGVVSFPIKQKYLPNIYCTASVIQPTKNSAFLYRAYGIIPVTVDINQKLAIEIDAKKSIRPKTKMELSLLVTREKKPLADTQVILALVDEGICQVTNFKTPDPFTFFYGKEKLLVQTLDGYQQILPEVLPGGSIEKLRTRVEKPLKHSKSVVIWQSKLITGVDGRIHTSVNIPQYTGELRIMAIAVKNTSFGSKTSSVKVSQPAMLEISAPRFAAWNDEFTVTAILQNQTGNNAKGNVILTTSEGFEVLRASKGERLIRQNGESVFSFQIKALKYFHHGQLHFSSYLGNEKLDKIVTIPLRSPIPKQKIHNSGSLMRGKPYKINLPKEFVGSAGKVKIVLSQKPSLRFKSSLDYLLQYPYGCLEQTTSCSFPLLYLGSILSKKNEEIKNYVEAGIERLSLMQTSWSGLSMWPGGYKTYPWGTVYATHFLIEASHAGYDVPKAFLERLLNYANKYSKGNYDKKKEREIQAYAFYVLALAGKLKYRDIAHMVENRILSSFEKCFVASALSLLGKKTAARSLLASNIQMTNSQETGGNLHSLVRDNAIYLSALLEVAPNDPRVDMLFQKLVACSKSGRWGTTQENAYALLSIGKCMRRFLQKEQLFNGSIKSDKRSLFHFQNEKEVLFSFDIENDKNIMLFVKGSGVFYYHLEVKGIPTSFASYTKKSSKSFLIDYKVFDDKGKLKTDSIHVGDLLWIEISLSSDFPYENIALESILPSGFEVENFRLANTAAVIPESFSCKNLLKSEYVDIRDDRIHFFFDMPWQKKGKIYYPIRATSVGKYFFAPIQAECMYNPHIQASTKSCMLKVIR